MASHSLLFLVCCFATVSELISTASPYHGKLIADLTTFDHGVSGTVYAVDSRRLRIVGFNYDGAAPDAFFWVGSTNSPSSTGVIVPDERGSVSTPLGGYSNSDITITLPGESTISDYKWLSVWCRRFTVDFGHVYFPSGFIAPSEHDLGEFSRLAHGLRGHPYIVDAKTFRIENLHYDGNGPDAYFWVGTGSRPHRNGIKVPDENGSTRPLRGYNGQTVSIQLAGDLTVFDIDWLSMWCVLAVQNFGHVFIPDNLNIPPHIEDIEPEEMYENCEAMNDKFHVSWTVGSDYIDFELSGQVDTGEYMAFGISGSDSRTAMIGADVTVTWNDGTESTKAVDYDLNAYSQCSQGSGACPDTEVSGARDDVSNIQSMIENGIVRIGFRRLLNTGDSKDKIIRTDREVYVAWALGYINSNGVVAKHHTVPTSGVKLHFGRQASNNCPAFTRTTLPPVRAWDQIRIRGDEGNTEFTARIGQAGGRRGYSAITGQVSWGIAWYINEKLIPILELLVGHSYTFIVEGGDDDSNTAQYHPLYITDDPIGGYIQKSTAERQDVEVFAGVEFDNGQPYPTAAGRYCEYESKGVDRSEDSETFDDYFKTLRLNCKAGDPAVLRWTPTKTGTYYYQCYTHQYLGWKIEVVDNFPGASEGPTGSATTYAGPAVSEGPTTGLTEMYENCEAMNDKFHVSWTVGSDYIDLELSGQVDIGEYMAFGISGSVSRTAMIGADVTVTWNDGTESMKAVDYDLNAYGQCRQGSGACPDTEVSGARDDVSNIQSMIENGIVRIGFRRLLNTGDSKDKIIRTDREVYVAWALGYVNSNGVVAKHHTVPTSGVKLHFGRQASNNCPAFTSTTLPPVRAWDQIRIRGDEGNSGFTARIGSAGGRRGYSAITGQKSAGIAWYINGKLIPILELLVGHNYTFIVEGGDDDSNTAQYHPFYITDDPIGGYIQKSTAERQDVQVFAGVEFDDGGQPYPTAAGRYCEYESKGVDRSEESETFDDYFKTLTLNCTEGDPAVLRWTPTKTGTYFYQSYTHPYIGWKIEVVDNFVSASHGLKAGLTVTCILLLCTLFYTHKDNL